MTNGLSHSPPVLNYNLKLIKNISKLKSFVAVKEDAKQHKFTINVIKKTKKNWSIIRSGGGMEGFFKYYPHGCQSWLAGIECIDPKIAFDFYKAILKKDYKFCKLIFKYIERPFFKLVSKYGWHLTIKSCLSFVKLMSSDERMPMKKLPKQQEKEIFNFIKKNKNIKSKQTTKKLLSISQMKKNFIGFIFARKNSKRLRRKNISKIGSKFLIEYTLIAALKSQIFKKIIVSTDDEKILSLKKKYDKIFFVKKPANLATDNIKNIEVILYYLKHFNIIKKYEYFSLMLPTCPFRNFMHLRKGHKLILNNPNVDCVFSANKSNFPIQFSLKIKNGFVKPFLKNSPLLSNNTRYKINLAPIFQMEAFGFATLKNFSKLKIFIKGKVKLLR